MSGRRSGRPSSRTLRGLIARWRQALQGRLTAARMQFAGPDLRNSALVDSESCGDVMCVFAATNADPYLNRVIERQSTRRHINVTQGDLLRCSRRAALTEIREANKASLVGARRYQRFV